MVGGLKIIFARQVYEQDLESPFGELRTKMPGHKIRAILESITVEYFDVVVASF